MVALAGEQLRRARASSSGRSAVMVTGGGSSVLRHTLIALTAGVRLGEHANPGEATVHVLSGRVLLHTSGDSCEGGSGDLLTVPDSTHSLLALDESVVLLTVAKRLTT